MKKVLQKSAGSYEPRGRLDPDGFERHVSFQTYLPPADLAPFIEHFWTIRWNQADNPYYSAEVMHPYVDVFVSGEQSGIQGTFRGKRIYVAAGSGRIVGIRFRPGAFHAFWGGALADLQDKIIDLSQVFPQINSRSERWLQQLFRDYVGIGLKWLLRRHKLLAAAQQIRASAQPNWTAIAYDLGYSSQQHFITDFKRVLGKTPRQYKKELGVL